MTILKKKEELRNNFKTKEVFYFVNEKENVNVLSREVFKKKPLEIHYPFNKNGSQKYKYIQSVEFDEISPHDVRGVIKSANFGLGFTRYLNPIIYKLETFPQIKKVIISKKQKSSFSRFSITFNIDDIGHLFRFIKPFRDVQSGELKVASNNLLAEIFPKKVVEEEREYVKGELNVFLKEHKIKPDELSDTDLESVIRLLPETISTEKLVFQAEEKINFIKLQKVREGFEKLLKQKTDTKTLEEKCQKFLTKNSWIISNILSIPVAILKGKAYVGGKDYTDKGGKVVDFLYQNSLTRNVFIIEIKTPLKKVIDNKTPYRKPDVFSIGKELTGGLIQILDQKDNLQREFYKLSQGKFEAFNPKALLIIGKTDNLNQKQLKSFELFRNNLKDVEVITFDELLERTNMIFGNFVKINKNYEN
jgi:Shedu protein SduA, C-terminal